jgi:hypothetical protein
MIDVDRIKREIPIESLIAQSGLTVAGKGHTLTTVEHDSLKIFIRNNSWTWYSQSGRDGKALGGSVIDWYKHAHQCSDGDAIRALSAMLDSAALPTMPQPRAVAAKGEPDAWQSGQWQQKALQRLERAQCRLYDTDDPAGEPGRAYLARRGLRYDMCVAFGLGYGDAWNAKAGRMMPALWVPWCNRKLTAIQYRFIEVAKGDQTADRFGQLSGGVRYVFGLQHCIEAAPGELQTLFLVEGELNAVSIFQSVYGQYPVDVVSYGPRNNITDHNRQMIAAIAKRYRKIIVWADEPDDAIQALQTIPNALPVRSPFINGKAHDANDLLVTGLIDDVVFELIRRAHDKN